MVTKDELKEGDEVQHRSGGQKMIYVGESEIGEAICEWFDGKKRQSGSFPYIALKRFENPFIGLGDTLA